MKYMTRKNMGLICLVVLFSCISVASVGCMSRIPDFTGKNRESIESWALATSKPSVIKVDAEYC